MSAPPLPPAVGRPLARTGRSLAATAIGLGLLALVGVLYVRQVTGGPVTAPMTTTPAVAFSVLSRDQRPADVVDDPSVRFVVRPETTRHLGSTASGRHYLGVGLTGEACLLTLPRGEPLESACTTMPNRPASAVLVQDDLDQGAGDALALVADGYRPSAPWRFVTTNLIVRSP